MVWVSFCVPVLNDNEKIRNLLKQFETQTDQNFELVIVDGGSTDGTWKSLKKAEQKMLQLRAYLEEGVQKSTGNARTQAIKKATGEYVLIVDSDLIIERNAVKKINKILSDSAENDIIVLKCKKDKKNMNTFFQRDNWTEGGKIIVRRKIHPGFYKECSFREDRLFYEYFDVDKYKIKIVESKIILYHYGVKNIYDFIHRYMWYGRTSIHYAKKTKSLVNKLEMLIVWPSIPIIPIGLILGAIKGLILINKFYSHNHIFDIILFAKFTLLETISVFAFSFGFWTWVFGNKKKSRD